MATPALSANRHTTQYVHYNVVILFVRVLEHVMKKLKTEMYVCLDPSEHRSAAARHISSSRVPGRSQ